MKICVVVPYDLAEQGGVKRHAFQLAAALRELGDHVTVMGASSKPTDSPDVQGFGGILNIPSNGSANHLAILTPPWRVRRWLHHQAFDVVHVHEPLCPLLAPYAALFAGHAKLVGTFHAYAEEEAWLPRTLRRVCGPLILPRFARGIAVSSPAASYARYVWKRDLAVIPNGIATEIFRPTPQPHRGTAPVRLLFVGHWRDERKGLPVLLAAVAKLRARGVAVELDVVGSGPTDTPLPEIPGVVFHGAESEAEAIATYVRDCDVFIAPSSGQESFGIVLLEAMASARAIVCSNIAGYRLVVDDATARLVPPGDVDGFAAAIAELAAAPALRRSLGEAGAARAATYAWSSLVHRVRAEYVAAL